MKTEAPRSRSSAEGEEEGAGEGEGEWMVGDDERKDGCLARQDEFELEERAA